MRIFIISFLIILIGCKNGELPKHTKDIGTLNSSPISPISEQANRFSTGLNYLQINSDKLNFKDRSISFELSWDGSWRMNDAYDAAWIFLKKKNVNGTWSHVKIRSDRIEVLENSSSDLAEAEIQIPPDHIGMMVFRKQNGEGDNNWRIRVALDLNSEEEQTEIRVFGLEMVHIASGPYELGTLKSIRDRREVLTQGAGGAPYNPFFTFNSQERDNYGGIYEVKSEDEIKIGKEDGNLYWIDANIPGTNTFSGIPEGVLSNDYPKGVSGFYQMKYELSQQEYCDFLNTLSPAQLKNRDISLTMEFKKPIADYRNMISNENGRFVTSRPNRPCNFISWLDGQAYADWAGLRHMTELEFEKSCRGPEPAIYREYVWGVNEIEDPSNMRYAGTFYSESGIARDENGGETIDGNIHASMFSYKNFIDVCTRQGNFYDPSSTGCRSFTGGDGGRGAVRKGIFGATSGGNRTKAGATYYGAMEMGGNLQEPVVSVGHPSGRKYQGSHGDGDLSPDGFSTNADWMPVENEYAFAGRGGCWKFHENHARTADRFKGLRTNQNRRASHIGFRGVRTDWTSN